MKKIAVLHTLVDVIAPFSARLKSAIPEEITVFNTLDEFLTIDVNQNGFTPRSYNRLFLALKAMELEEPDYIICTCTTMSEGIEQLRHLIAAPILAIDDALCAEAVRQGSLIAILASVPGLIRPIQKKISALAAQEGKEVTAVPYLCEEAMRFLRSGKSAEHDKAVMSAVKEIREADIVILPQASMSHLKSAIEESTGLPVLLCTDLCIERAAKLVCEG